MDATDFGLVDVPAGSVDIGTTRGGWMHGKDRPAFRAELPSFRIMSNPLTPTLATKVLGREMDELEGWATGWDDATLGELREGLTELRSPEGMEWRLPSPAEWERAIAFGSISMPHGFEEILEGHPHPDHRGARFDGAPRWVEHDRSMMTRYREGRKSHPSRSDVFIAQPIPVFAPQGTAILRLVLTPTRPEDAPIVPRSADLRRRILEEVLIVTLVGIVPSFLIPVMNGAVGYLAEGWPNLVFGGVLIGVATGTLWRPRTRRWILGEDGAEHASDRSIPTTE